MSDTGWANTGPADTGPADTVQALDALAALPAPAARERALAQAGAAAQRADPLGEALFRAAATVGPNPALAGRIGALIAEARDPVDPELAARAYDLAAALEASPAASVPWLIGRAEVLAGLRPADAEAAIAEARRADLAPVDEVRLELLDHRLRFGDPSAPRADLARHIEAMADEQPRLALKAAVLHAFDAWWSDARRFGTLPTIGIEADDEASLAERDFALGVLAVLGGRSPAGRLAASAAAATRARAAGSSDPLLGAIEAAVAVLMADPAAIPELLAILAPAGEAPGFALGALDAAARGEAEACRELSAAGIESGIREGQLWLASLALAAHGRLELGLGNLEPALTMLQRVSDPDDMLGHPITARLFAADVIEAAVRTGRVELAREAAAGLERWGADEGGFSRAVLARFRALLAEPDQADELFERAIALADGQSFEEARTRLLYGEHLRRTRRRVLARAELRLASGLFAETGAAPWARRAERELQATAETARRSPALHAQAHLTPRERQVADLVVAGASNQEVAEQLILSRKTVEHHLHNIYSRFGIASRAELADLLEGLPGQ